ncbi:MAG: c-type cytochrome [Anaerolineae bacterium]|nr:c-type cytochrome [Anaerolineae bacterium]
MTRARYYAPLALIPIFLFATVALTGCELSFAGDITPPPNASPRVTQSPAMVSAVYPIVAPDLATGQAIYTEKCAPCHGESGGGDGPSASGLPNPPTALSSAQIARVAAPADWFAIISQGNLERFMPRFSDSLTDRDIWDVVAYTFSLSAPLESLPSAATTYQAYCETCHGSDGSGNGPRAASLAVPLPDWRDASQLTNKSLEYLYTLTSQGNANNMPGFADELTDDQLWMMSVYIRTFALGVPAVLVDGDVPGADTPPQPGTFNLTGRLENASGGNLLANMPVKLQMLDAMQVTQTLETTAETDGSYHFNNLELAEGRVFLVSTEYQQMTFHADPLQAADIRPGDEARLPLRVYETSSDPSALVVDRLHIFLENAGAGALQVVELYLISNTSKTVILPSAPGQTIIDFSLPSGAANLQFEDGVLGERFLETANGFGDTQMVFPGEQQLQVLFAYEIPFERKSTLAISTPLLTRSVIVAVPNGVVKLQSPQLTFTGGRSIQGSTINTYEASMMNAGTNIQMQMSSPLRNPIAGLAGNQLASGLLSAGIFLLVIGAAGLFLKRQRTAQDPGGKVDPVNQDSLLDEILALDDLYQAGNIPLDAYQQRRAELMDLLHEITHQ